MKIIQASKLLFKKICRNVKFEKDCIEKSQTLRPCRYREVNHRLYLKWEWHKVNDCLKKAKSKQYWGDKSYQPNQEILWRRQKRLWLTFYEKKWGHSLAHGCQKQSDLPKPTLILDFEGKT